jgi:hypothetical protein
VKDLKKQKLLIFPLLLGLILMVYSWFSSYPLSINAVNDYVFNHLSICYWFGLPITVASMFMIAATSRNNIVKWVMTVGIVTAMYSLNYYYSSLPTSDANFYRGLNENFADTKSLEISSYAQTYYQWPSVFILTYVVSAISGLKLVNLEFLMFALLGILFATLLYLYSSKSFEKGGFLAVIAFFIMGSSYVNYQFAAYTIAFCFLLLLLILDTERPSSSVTLTMLLLFIILAFTHAYAPIFFSIFLLVNFIISRSKRYLELFLFSLAIYFVYQLTSASYSFASNILRAISHESEVSSVATIVPWSNPIDAIAQKFTVPTVIICALVCFIGFALLLAKRKLRLQDKSIFVTGCLYLCLGVVLYTLGSRAIAIAFIAITLGASYLFQSKFRQYSKVIFLILLILFTFVPMRLTFFKSGVFFQTNESYDSSTFLFDNYNWTRSSLIVADYRTTDYLAGKTAEGNTVFSTDSDPSKFEHADAILYTIGLGINMDYYFNYTIEDVLNQDMLNVFYDNGYSIVIIRANQ